MFIADTYLNQINYHYEASASNCGYDEHGVYRLLLFGACWSGLDISASYSGLLLAAETFKKAK